jgi:GNAT superfamily N-acetyltransferase
VRDALVLAKEYGAWAVHVAKSEYGVDAEAESEEGLSTSIADLLQPRGRLYLAERNGTPVGLGGLRPVSDATAEIKRVYVRPSGRGRGIGRAIVEKLLGEARELGFTRIRLESAAFMREAQNLYRSFGFFEVEPYEGREFAGIDGAEEIQVFMALDVK